MGTKKLSRTAIEGGRTGRNKWERRNSHNTERTSERDFCQKVKIDPESADCLDITKKERIDKEFNDKLGPMYRWLNNQLGRPWDEVRSEIAQTFDTRTTAGRHITYDHLLSSVEVTPAVWRYRHYYNTGDDNTSYYRHDFFVSDEGILCKRQYISRDARYPKVPSFDTAHIANWLSGRTIGQVGDKFYWFVPSDKNKKRGGNCRSWRTTWERIGWNGSGLRYSYLHNILVYKRDSVGNLIYEKGNPVVSSYQETWQYSIPIFRQDRKLNDKELSFWKTIPEYYRIKVMELSPVYQGPVTPKPYYYY